ncbi:MAG: hypothetical protein J3Q66DRAFT_367011 [Benniella sp.]|nr:MAG: hypothetical protein J3Q66DRAFT_367011 [Benniella sp.]
MSDMSDNLSEFVWIAKSKQREVTEVIREAALAQKTTLLTTLLRVLLRIHRERKRKGGSTTTDNMEHSQNQQQPGHKALRKKQKYKILNLCNDLATATSPSKNQKRVSELAKMGAEGPGAGSGATHVASMVKRGCGGSPTVQKHLAKLNKGDDADDVDHNNRRFKEKTSVKVTRNLTPLQVLQAYVESFFEYLQERKGADATTRASLEPPLLTTITKSKYRYAASNCLQTDGLRIHLQAFDITRAHAYRKTRMRIPDIQTLFRDRPTIHETFGGDLSRVSVIGVDPGERISASFCSVSLGNPNTVSNLRVRRKALYQPALS